MDKVLGALEKRNGILGISAPRISIPGGLMSCHNPMPRSVGVNCVHKGFSSLPGLRLFAPELWVAGLNPDTAWAIFADEETLPSCAPGEWD